MSANALTIIVGVVGFLASVVSSGVFYRRGTRAAENQKAELLLALKQERNLLSRFVRSVAGQTAYAALAEPRVQPVVADRSPSSAGAAGPEASTSALELLVRASLGALLDERGRVQLARLFQEVGEALGTPHYEDTVQVLRQLRGTGAVDWDGPDDLHEVQEVRVLPGAHLAGTEAR